MREPYHILCSDDEETLDEHGGTHIALSSLFSGAHRLLVMLSANPTHDTSALMINTASVRAKRKIRPTRRVPAYFQNFLRECDGPGMHAPSPSSSSSAPSTSSGTKYPRKTRLFNTQNMEYFLPSGTSTSTPPLTQLFGFVLVVSCYSRY